jgi:hypothetical protein
MFTLCSAKNKSRTVANKPFAQSPTWPHAVDRSGLTLLELLVSITITVMVMGSLGAMAKAVNEGASYGESYGTATQHARVAIERIGASVRGATTSDSFPGLLVLEETVDGWGFPDTVVVWYPEGVAVDPKGLPRMNELRVYCPNPDAPNELLELTLPDDSRVAPPPGDRAAWLAETADMKNSQAAVRTILTNMLRTATVSASEWSRRGAVRFAARYRPDEAEMASHAAGTANWKDLAWPQGICTEGVGMRQVWLSMELQLVPASTSSSVRSSDQTAIPYLGSASQFFEVHP